MYLLDKNDLSFPHPFFADENGILAIGGDLKLERILFAYSHGIFPWYNPGDPIIWHFPDPRFVLFPDELKVSKSMRPYFNQNKFSVTYNKNFFEVISNCRNVYRKDQYGESWITDEMEIAYTKLHKQGFAHSVEVWKGDKLVGGLYGLILGDVFFGESMFSYESNASKFGFISIVKYLREKGIKLIDCQQETSIMASFGARNITGKEFYELIESNCSLERFTFQLI